MADAGCLHVAACTQCTAAQSWSPRSSTLPVFKSSLMESHWSIGSGKLLSQLIDPERKGGLEDGQGGGSPEPGLGCPDLKPLGTNKYFLLF